MRIKLFTFYLLLISFTLCGQRFSLRVGPELIFSDQFGPSINMDNVVLQEISNMGYSDKPDFGLFAQVDYHKTGRFSFSGTVDYVSLGATFLSYDEDERDPIFGIVEKIHIVRNPVLGLSINPGFEVLKFRGVSFRLKSGINLQISLPTPNQTVVFAYNRHPRVSEVLSQTDDSIKDFLLFYDYGVSILFRKISIDISGERTFSNSFLSNIELQGSNYEVKAKRSLIKLALGYKIF